MFIIDGYMKLLAFFCILLLCRWVWGMFLQKNDPNAYRRHVAQDQFAKTQGLKLAAKLLNKLK